MGIGGQWATAGLLLVLLSQALVAPALADGQGPEEVMEAFEAAVNRRDVDAAVQLFADGARVEADRSLSTRGQIRAWVRDLVAHNAHVHLGSYRVNGDRATLLVEVGEGEWYQNGPAPLRSMAEVRLRDGRIATLSVRQGAGLIPTSIGSAIMTGPIGLALAGSLAGLVLVVGLGLYLAHQPEAAAPRQRGRLMAGLRLWVERGRPAA